MKQKLMEKLNEGKLWFTFGKGALGVLGTIIFIGALSLIFAPELPGDFGYGLLALIEGFVIAIGLYLWHKEVTKFRSLAVGC